MTLGVDHWWHYCWWCGHMTTVFVDYDEPHPCHDCDAVRARLLATLRDRMFRIAGDRVIRDHTEDFAYLASR